MPRPLALLLLVVLAGPAAGQNVAPITEGFDNVAGLTAAGWAFVNNTPGPNPNGQWRQGSLNAGGAASSPFAPQAGAAGAYVRSDYTASSTTAAAVTVSDWLVLPTRTMVNGGTLSFWTRTNDGSLFAERLAVRLSTSGASANVGTGPDEVGDFTTTLLTINPTLQVAAAGYPDAWTQFTVTIAGLSGPTDGRLALHHYVTNSGPGGLNGDQLAFDTLYYNPVPEPAGLLLVAALGVAGRTLRAATRPR